MRPFIGEVDAQPEWQATGQVKIYKCTSHVCGIHCSNEFILKHSKPKMSSTPPTRGICIIRAVEINSTEAHSVLQTISRHRCNRWRGWYCTPEAKEVGIYAQKSPSFVKVPGETPVLRSRL